MRHIYLLILAGVMMLAYSCHKPEYIAPTADRQGLTSLEAIFTFGPYIDQTMGKLTVTDENADRFVIPIPWFFPETSDDETTPYMTKVRVKASIDANCIIDPPISILDLTQDNYFTYTNAKGVSKTICITGERVKSAACELQAFSIVEPPISGLVDQESKTVSLITADDLVSCVATAQVSAHATISPDPAEARSYDNPVVFTVTAHDGVTKAEYTVSKDVPEKISSGFNSTSVAQLFNFEPSSRVGFPAYSETVYPSMAMIGNSLVVSFGSGTPVCLNAVTGVKEGELNLGSAVAASIVGDEGGNLLICNHADGGGTINIYKSTSVTEAPVLFHTFTNSTDLPMGYKMKVMGDVSKDALIVITNEGITDVTTSSKFTTVTVRDGAVTSTDVVDISASGHGWGAAPVNNTAVVPVSTDPADGFLFAYYSDNHLFWVKSDGSIVASSPDASNPNGNFNVNTLDSKTFNNVRYAAWLVTSHFPMWGCGPSLYMFDISSSSNISEFKPVLSNPSIEWYQQANTGCCAGDVIIANSTDGFKMYVYYYDHNSGVLGGYTADCIKR